MSKPRASDGSTIIQTIVIPHSTEGHSIYDVDRVDSANIRDFQPDEGRRAEAATHLRKIGFEVHDLGGPALVVSGPKSLYESAFRQPLARRLHPIGVFDGTTEHVESFHPRTTDVPGLIPVAQEHHDELSRVVRGVTVTEPVQFFAKPKKNPPSVSYHHFSVPDGIAAALQATDAHAAGFHGKGVKVALCDTGFERHPWFAGRKAKIKVVLTPHAKGSDKDEIGHGTAVAANLISLAPRCRLTVVKMKYEGKSGSLDALPALMAANLSGAKIISCSWGTNIASKAELMNSSHARALEYTVTQLCHTGCVMLFASGDYPHERPPSRKGMFGFPAQHPEAIAVGGTTVQADGQLVAASYASGFRSEVYPMRNVPDICGLCGQLPAGVLIMSPVPPGSDIDRWASMHPYPDGDETQPADGWACISGTSLATPHVAGIAALVLQANPALADSSLMRSVLRLSARDVRHGNSNPNATHSGRLNQAHPGIDLATGAGLVDAGRAVSLARVLALHDKGAETGLTRALKKLEKKSGSGRGG